MRNPLRLNSTLAAALAAALLTPAAALADVPEGATWEEAYIPSTGGVVLHADVMRPKDLPKDAKTPVILAIGPYFGHAASAITDFDPTKQGPNDRFDDMIEGGKVFERGYTVVYVDSRGFGASTGCNDFGGNGEQADAKVAVEWAASQPWSTGKVGMWGKSYDAWTQVMALANQPKGLAAAVIQAPIIDGYRTLYQNGVHYDSGWYGTPALYQGIDATPPTVFDDPAYFAGFAQGTNPLCYGTNIAMQNTTLDRDTPFWQERELTERAVKNEAAVLWSHGFLDANTKPDNFAPIFTRLKGPKRAWFGQYDHVRGNESEVVGRKGFMDEAMRWFDRFLKGKSLREAPVDKDPAVEVQDNEGKWRGEAQWPPADAVMHKMTLKGGTFTDSLDSTDGFWTVTPPFPYDARIAGVPRAELQASTVSPRAHLFVRVYDVAKDGTAELLTRSAHMVAGAENDLKFDLYPEDWVVRAGHRLAVIVSGNDAAWYLPPHSQQQVTVEPGGTIALPFLKYVRTSDLKGGQAAAWDARAEDAAVSESVVAGGLTEFKFPPRMTARPAISAATTRLSATLKRKGRRLTVAGRAPKGAKVTVQLTRSGRVVATRRVTVRSRSYRLTFKVRAAGSYRATATTRGRFGVQRRTTQRVRVR